MMGFIGQLLFPGRLCGCSGMAALKEGSGLASVQKHLHGLVCDCAHLWSDQCSHHGHLHLRHPVSIQLQPEQGRRKTNRSSAQQEKRRKVGRPKYIAYLKPVALEEKGRKICKKFEGSCDMGLWFLAASFST